MKKDVLFYNEIGRQGKSSLAYNFYDNRKRAGENVKYITNDMANISFAANRLIKDDLVEIRAGEGVDIDTDDLNIFDFGGFIDDRVVSVIKHVDYVVIPISYSSNNELILTAKVIEAVSELNKNIVVVFNKTKTSKLKRGKQMFSLLLQTNELDVLETFTINESEYITRLADEGKSIYEVAEENKGDRTRLEKALLPQFNELYTYLTK